MNKRENAKGILTLVFLLVVGLVASLYVNELFGVNDISGKITADDPDLCYFLDSNGDCATTTTDVAAARDLASLKPISCAISTTGGYNECKRTLDANGDGFVTSSDVTILKDKASLRSADLPGAPAQIVKISPAQIDGVNPYELELRVLTQTGLPSVLIGVNVLGERKFTDLNGIVSFTIPGSVQTVNAIINSHPNKGVSSDITFTKCMPTCSFCGGEDNGCGGICQNRRSLSLLFEDPADYTIVTDSSGNNNNGIKYGGVTQVAGKIGNALNFNVVGAYITINNVPLTYEGDITVLTWAKSNTADWNNYGWIANARMANGFLINPNSGGKTWSGHFINSIGGYNIIGTHTPLDSITDWHQYGIMYNFASKEAFMIYDGQIVVRKNIDITRTAGTLNVTVGRDTYDPLVRYGNGAIDEVEVYRFALTEQEILARYQATSHLCA